MPSMEEQRKHKLLPNQPTPLAMNIKYTFRRPNQTPENPEEEIITPETIIYPRWMNSIRNSIDRYNIYINSKIQSKQTIAQNNNFDPTILQRLSIYALNRWDIHFYKILSPRVGEDMVNYFTRNLELRSFTLIKKDFNNTCISCLLNYEDSTVLI
jgi:hypothetical protein